MAVTRHATGNSRPRILQSLAPPAASSSAPKQQRQRQRPRKGIPASRITAATSTASKATKKAAGPPPRRVSKTTTKTTTTTTRRKGATPISRRGRKPTVGDKVKGAARKAVGAIEGRPPGKEAAGTKESRGLSGKVAGRRP